MSGAWPLSSLSPPDPPPSHSSSGGFRLVLMHPTLVSLRYPETASVASFFQSHLTKGALGCFHLHSFPLSFQNHLICCSQARNSMKREWRPPSAPQASTVVRLAGSVLQVGADCRLSGQELVISASDQLSRSSEGPALDPLPSRRPVLSLQLDVVFSPLGGQTGSGL